MTTTRCCGAVRVSVSAPALAPASSWVCPFAAECRATNWGLVGLIVGFTFGYVMLQYFVSQSSRGITKVPACLLAPLVVDMRFAGVLLLRANAILATGRQLAVGSARRRPFHRQWRRAGARFRAVVRVPS